MPSEDKKRLTESAYKELMAFVDEKLKEADKAGRSADSNRALAYWEIGDKILEAGLTGRNHYGESVIEKMGEDLDTDPQTIRRAVVFRRVYTKQELYPGVQNLTWSAYRQLIEIHDDAARKFYEDKAIKEGWSRDRLRAAIAGKEYEREVKKNTDAGVLKRPTEADYVFGAEVVDIVDGDTLVLNIDTGFKNRRYGERIRLAKLNAPELYTKKGKEVRDYVRDRLMKACGIVVKTEKTDDYGRYLGHVFYSFDDDRPGRVYAEGIYLNDELLKKKMAERM
jgi:endonuclease YncB( thermonuclease family)